MQPAAHSFQTSSYIETVEMFFDKGWTDGLPVVLPERSLVEAMIAASGRDRNESLGPIPPRHGEATIEKLAINAVMGGCRPEYFPVVIAAFEAMMQPQHNINGVTQTTHMCVSLAIVNGPISRELKFNSRNGVFGNGYRANGAVGRAIRLGLWNLGGAVPWDTDMATLSHPGEYAFCIAEEEEDNPWDPLHVDRGCAPGSDAVTVFACEGPHSVICQGTPGEMIYVLADCMSTLGANNIAIGGQIMVVLNPRIAGEFHENGWSKRDVKQALWETARRSMAEIQACGAYNESIRKAQLEAKLVHHRYGSVHPKAMVPVSDSPDDIHVVVAGGRTYFAAVLPGWGSVGGYAATAPIRRPQT